MNKSVKGQEYGHFFRFLMRVTEYYRPKDRPVLLNILNLFLESPILSLESVQINLLLRSPKRRVFSLSYQITFQTHLFFLQIRQRPRDQKNSVLDLVVALLSYIYFTIVEIFPLSVQLGGYTKIRTALPKVLRDAVLLHAVFI